MSVEITPDNFVKVAKFRAVLEVYVQVGSVIETCKLTGITHQTWKLWKKDPDFQELLEEIQEDIVSRLEAELFKRAVIGEEEDVYYKGQVVGTKRKKSDYLLGLALQANKPEKYRHNVSVDQTGTMNLNHKGTFEHLEVVRHDLLSAPDYIEYIQSKDYRSLPDSGSVCTDGDRRAISVSPPCEAD